MAARTLRENKYQGDDRQCEDNCRTRAAELESAVGDRLVEQVAERRAERSGEDERCPEQKDARYVSEVIDRSEE